MLYNVMSLWHSELVRNVSLTFIHPILWPLMGGGHLPSLLPYNFRTLPAQDSQWTASPHATCRPTHNTEGLMAPTRVHATAHHPTPALHTTGSSPAAGYRCCDGPDVALNPDVSRVANLLLRPINPAGWGAAAACHRQRPEVTVISIRACRPGCHWRAVYVRCGHPTGSWDLLIVPPIASKYETASLLFFFLSHAASLLGDEEHDVIYLVCR